MFFFVTTVMTQRSGRLDATSLTERTSPVTNEPSIDNVALSFLYWANRQRRARFGSVVSNVFMRHRWSRYAIQFRDGSHRSSEALIKDSPSRLLAEATRHLPDDFSNPKNGQEE
jgi:hypothetical protein